MSDVPQSAAETAAADGQTLVEHLAELRRRLMYMAAGVLLCLAVALPFANELYTLAALPLMANLPAGSQMQAIDIVAPFFVPLKVAAMTAFLVSLPHTLYQLWAFVAPALYRHEKRLVLPLVVSSVLLFFAGMAFCYFAVFPVMFEFLPATAPEGIQVTPDIGSYLSLIMGLFAAFGATFEVPVLVVLLHRMGIVELSALRAARPYVVVAAFVVAGVLTPPDVLSQFLMAVPLLVLYEVGLLVCRWVSVRREETAGGDEAA